MIFDFTEDISSYKMRYAMELQDTVEEMRSATLGVLQNSKLDLNVVEKSSLNMALGKNVPVPVSSKRRVNGKYVVPENPIKVADGVFVTHLPNGYPKKKSHGFAWVPALGAKQYD